MILTHLLTLMHRSGVILRQLLTASQEVTMFPAPQFRRQLRYTPCSKPFYQRVLHPASPSHNLNRLKVLHSILNRLSSHLRAPAIREAVDPSSRSCSMSRSTTSLGTKPGGSPGLPSIQVYTLGCMCYPSHRTEHYQLTILSPGIGCLPRVPSQEDTAV